jgi:hypothetical protein
VLSAFAQRGAKADLRLLFPHAGIRRTGPGGFMDWRGGGFSAYDLVHGVITAKATAPVIIAQVVMKSRDSLDGP